jgi:hypothetical protein
MSENRTMQKFLRELVTRESLVILAYDQDLRLTRTRYNAAHGTITASDPLRARGLSSIDSTTLRP